MTPDPNVDAIGLDLARQNLKSNVDNYGATALVQSVEITALEGLGDGLDNNGKTELAARKRELSIAEAKRQAFSDALAKLPAADAKTD